MKYNSLKLTQNLNFEQRNLAHNNVLELKNYSLDQWMKLFNLIKKKKSSIYMFKITVALRIDQITAK